MENEELSWLNFYSNICLKLIWHCPNFFVYYYYCSRRKLKEKCFELSDIQGFSLYNDFVWTFFIIFICVRPFLICLITHCFLVVFGTHLFHSKWNSFILLFWVPIYSYFECYFAFGHQIERSMHTSSNFCIQFCIILFRYLQIHIHETSLTRWNKALNNCFI